MGIEGGAPGIAPGRLALAEDLVTLETAGLVVSQLRFVLEAECWRLRKRLIGLGADVGLILDQAHGLEVAPFGQGLDDAKLPLRLEHPRGFAKRLGHIVGVDMMEAVRVHDDIDRCVLEGKVFRPAQQVGDVLASRRGAGGGEGGIVDVYAEHFSALGGERAGEPALAAADIDDAPPVKLEELLDDIGAVGHANLPCPGHWFSLSPLFALRSTRSFRGRCA